MFITLHRLCKEYGVLPHPGGLFDQDPYVIYGLNGVINAIDQKRALEEQRQQAEIDKARRGG